MRRYYQGGPVKAAPKRKSKAEEIFLEGANSYPESAASEGTVQKDKPKPPKK